MEFLDTWKDGIFNILRRQSSTENRKMEVLLIRVRSQREFIKSEYTKKSVEELDDYDLKSLFHTILKSNAEYKCTEMKIELGTFKILENLSQNQTNEIKEEVEKCDVS